MKIPSSVIELAEKELSSFTHGNVKIEIVIHDSHPKFRITKQVSIKLDEPASGTQKKK